MTFDAVTTAFITNPVYVSCFVFERAGGGDSWMVGQMMALISCLQSHSGPFVVSWFLRACVLTCSFSQLMKRKITKTSKTS